ncbi:MAG: transporter [Gammaproteobacteria bacterium]|nr:transporter [Gammaproteobacteria bacterium]
MKLRRFNNIYRYTYILVLMTSWHIPTLADEESEVSGDRPDFTEATSTVPAGKLQLESGYTLASSKQSGSTARAHNYPEVLLRYGVTEALEMRLVTGDLINYRSAGGNATERSDAALGTKFKLYKDAASPWKLSMLAALSLPSGSKNETTDGYDPEVKLAWSRELPSDIDVSGNLVWAMPTAAGKRHTEYGVSLSVGFEFVERTGLFVEVYSIDAGAAYGGRADTFNFGTVYKILPNFLVDARYGLDLKKTTDEQFFGVGFVYQFGHK